jgi:hypothetical protein
MRYSNSKFMNIKLDLNKSEWFKHIYPLLCFFGEKQMVLLAVVY